jgi:hypothetical protein
MADSVHPELIDPVPTARLGQLARRPACGVLRRDRSWARFGVEPVRALRAALPVLRDDQIRSSSAYRS